MKKYLFILIAISFISCNSTKQTINKNDYVYVRPFKIKDTEFEDLIKKSIDNYKIKYKESPNIILIELLSNNENDTLDFYVTNELFLYVNQEDKLFLNEDFIAYGEIQKIPVLIKSIVGGYKRFEKYFELGIKKHSYKVDYGNSANSCTQQFNIINDKINITKSYCTFDLK